MFFSIYICVIKFAGKGAIYCDSVALSGVGRPELAQVIFATFSTSTSTSTVVWREGTGWILPGR